MTVSRRALLFAALVLLAVAIAHRGPVVPAVLELPGGHTFGLIAQRGAAHLSLSASHYARSSGKTTNFGRVRLPDWPVVLMLGVGGFLVTYVPRRQ